MAMAALIGGFPSLAEIHHHKSDSWFTDALKEISASRRFSSSGFQTGKVREPPKLVGKDAVQYYNRLVSEGLPPSLPTSISALRACSGLRDLGNGVRIHHHLLQRQQHLNMYAATALMDMYLNCGIASEARKVFDTLPSPNEVAWNVLISGYSDCGEAQGALSLFLQMQRESKPDGRSFVAALKACSVLALQEDKSQLGEEFIKARCLETGMAIHAHAWRSGFQDNIYVRNTLVDMYGKCCSIQDARRVFETNPSVCVISWNALIMGYAEVGQPEEALRLFSRMQEEGFTADARSYVAALRAVSVSADVEKALDLGAEDEVKRGFKLLQLEKGMAIHSQVSEKGWDDNVFVGSSLVVMYGKCGSLEDSARVFNRMKNRDIVTWTNLMLACVENNEPELALRMFKRLKVEQRLQPDAGAYIAALRACASLAALEAGRVIHREFEHQPFARTTIVATCLVDFYSKCGSMSEARSAFESIQKPDLVAWNTMLAGYADHGDYEHALELFERMKTAIRPDGVSFLLVLSACSHVGLLDKGREFFDSIPASCREPEHYSCMIDLLGRANEIDEAVELLRGMPVEPNKSIWTALLTACQKWGNVEVGRIAFQALLKLDEKGSPAYLLMANSYELNASEA